MLLSAQNHIAKLYRDLAKVRHDMSVADIAQKTINKYFDQELQEVRTTNSNLIDTLEEKEQLCKDLSKKLLEYEEKKDCSNCKEELEKHEKAMEAIKTENHKEIENLQRSIIQKNQEISKLAEIQVDLEGKLNQMSVEKEQMKIEQEEKKLSNNLHESNSLQNHTKVSNVTETCKKSVISSSLSAGNLIWDSSDPTELSVDLKKMSELEEELIETKEKWARLNEDKTELASQLQNMTDKYNKMAQRSFMDILMYIVPMAVVLLYVLIHPYIS